MEIDWQTPPLIEVVGIAEDCSVFVAGMNGSGDELVMLGVIADFDIRLRIYIQMWRSIHEAHGKKIRLFDRDQADWLVPYLGFMQSVLRIIASKTATQAFVDSREPSD